MHTGVQARLLRLIRRQELGGYPVVLHYDSEASGLRPWFWPVDKEQRIPPSDFERHGVTHDFKNPCCLCAAGGSGLAYTESVVCLDTDGPYAGEYVARCAMDKCGYFIPLERMYAKRGLYVKKYDVQAPVGFMGFFPTTAAAYMQAATVAPSAPNHMNILLQLLQLDASTSPGLPEPEFRNLFRKCRFCGMIVTRRVRKYHNCTVHLTLND